ncbi:MAG: CBS domain-containing protein [Candidatus Micrarchaeia archaeon]
MIAFEGIPSEFVTKTPIYEYKVPITEALDKINQLTAVVITKNKSYYGIVDDRTLTRKGTLKLTKKYSIGKFAKKVPLLDNSTSIEKAIVYFYTEGVKALPYMEGDVIKGVVKRSEMLKAILSFHMLSNIKVESAMTSPIIAIDSNANMAQAKDAMQENKVNRLAVINNGKLFGIITYKDMMKAFSTSSGRAPKYKNYYSLSGTTVGSACERNIHTIEQNMLVDNAIREFLNKNISSLIVTRNQKPVGIITVKDVFELIASSSLESANKVIISGLDDYTKEYEEDIKAELNDLANKINRFRRIGVNYISLNIKRSKTRNYEMRGKLVLKKGGTFAAASQGYSLESVLRDITKKLYKFAEGKKEIVIKNKRENEVHE